LGVYLYSGEYTSNGLDYFDYGVQLNGRILKNFAFVQCNAHLVPKLVEIEGLELKLLEATRARIIATSEARVLKPKITAEYRVNWLTIYDTINR
jgi:hypothetical protein